MRWDGMSDDVRVLVAASLLSATMGALLVTHVRKRLERRGRVRTQVRAARGEALAGRVLKAEGFQVLQAQAETEYVLTASGQEVTVKLKADALVSKGGELFVAEVKTGDGAPRIETAATRRQLLEYWHAFEPDGLLLVEPESGKISEIRFPWGRRQSPMDEGVRRWLWLSVGALLGIAAASWVARFGS